MRQTRDKVEEVQPSYLAKTCHDIAHGAIVQALAITNKFVYARHDTLSAFCVHFLASHSLNMIE